MLLTAAQAVLARGRNTVAMLIRRRDPTRFDQEIAAPIRGELLNPDQLDQRARAIAATHTATLRAGDVRMLRTALDRNQRVIGAAHHTLSQDTRPREITPAAEWLLDNFHIVVDQIREIRQDLPRGYYDELPKLTSGPLAGQPRVYAIALDLIEHTDGRLDLEQLLRFILAYQSITPLTIGELWAVAIMLRFGLVENLARLAGIILAARAARDAADDWADRLLAEDVGADMAHSPVLAELAQHHPDLSSAFALRLLYRLRTYDGERDTGAIVTWLEQQPVIPYNNVEALIHAEHQRQAANQAAIGNTITSMRTLSAIDWADWFEQVSLVDQALRQDPAGAYGRSTFATRDHYRHAVEQLARRSGASELDVARRAVERARTAPQEGGPRGAHVGYYLIGTGRAALEAELGYHPTPAQAVQRVILRRPTAFYLGSLAATTAAGVMVGLRLLDKGRRTKDENRLSAGVEPSRSAGLLPSFVFRLSYAALLALPASALAKELVDRCAPPVAACSATARPARRHPGRAAHDGGHPDTAADPRQRARPDRGAGGAGAG
jgi:cyclic beta-1,2-glucan synthetase